MKNTPYLDKPLRPLVEVETLREDRLAEEGMRVETDPFAKAAPRPWIPIARYASLLIEKWRVEIEAESAEDRT